MIIIYIKDQIFNINFVDVTFLEKVYITWGYNCIVNYPVILKNTELLRRMIKSFLMLHTFYSVE